MKMDGYAVHFHVSQGLASLALIFYIAWHNAYAESL
jgi:hypothetical protein